MKNLLFILVIAGLLGVSVGAGSALGTYLYLRQTDTTPLGATTARTTITNPWFFAATTTMNSNLIVTTANTATSSIQVGCVQFYATSTATAQRFLASTTPGIMYSDYGKCPKI